MNKIFALALLIFSFGCGHSATSKIAATYVDPNLSLSAKVEIGEFVFTKPAGWSMAAEYKCIVYWDKPVDFESERMPLQCLVRKMHSALQNFHIEVRVRGLNNPRRTITQLCFESGNGEDCYKDRERVVLYRRQGNLHTVYMVFFSDPNTEILFEVNMVSEMILQEMQTLAVLVKSFHPR